MSFIVSNLTDYTQIATEMFRTNVLFSDDFSKYNLQTGIDYKSRLNWLDTTVTVQEGGCGLTPGDETTIYEKELEVGYYGIPMKFCYDDLRKKEIRAENFEQELTQSIVDKVKAKVETDFWNGSKTGGDLIDGLITQLSAATNVIEVTSSASTLTTIIGNINDLIDGVTNAMWTKAGQLVIHTDVATYNMYRRALVTGNYYHLDNSELGSMEMWVFGYEGKVKIKAEAGFTPSAEVRMLLLSDDNIFVGTDELQMVSSIEIVNDPITDYVYYKTKFKFGVTYLFEDEVVRLSDI